MKTRDEEEHNAMQDIAEGIHTYGDVIAFHARREMLRASDPKDMGIAIGARKAAKAGLMLAIDCHAELLRARLAEVEEQKRRVVLELEDYKTRAEREERHIVELFKNLREELGTNYPTAEEVVGAAIDVIQKSKYQKLAADIMDGSL